MSKESRKELQIPAWLRGKKIYDKTFVVEMVSSMVNRQENNGETQVAARFGCFEGLCEGASSGDKVKRGQRRSFTNDAWKESKKGRGLGGKHLRLHT